jgi:hypothetical protein
MNREFMEYIDHHDLDEDEAEKLAEWAGTNHSVYENPWHQYDDWGEEIPYIKWLRQIQDPYHPNSRRKCLLNEAMRTGMEFSNTEDELAFLKEAQRKLKDEIILYRRFLASIPGAVNKYEEYRYRETGE